MKPEEESKVSASQTFTFKGDMLVLGAIALEYGASAESPVRGWGNVGTRYPLVVDGVRYTVGTKRRNRELGILITMTNFTDRSKIDECWIPLKALKNISFSVECVRDADI